MIKTLLIDNQKLLADCFSLVFQQKEMGIDLSVADNCKKGVLQLKNKNIDVVLYDMSMKENDVSKSIKYLKRKFQKIKIIIITDDLDNETLYNIWMCGTDAILSKNCGINVLVDSIKQVYQGQRIISKHIPDFFSYLALQNKTNHPHLSPREEDVLKLLATGLTRREVATHLFVSVETINFHCKNLLKKFKQNKMNLLINKARELNIISDKKSDTNNMKKTH